MQLILWSIHAQRWYNKQLQRAPTAVLRVSSGSTVNFYTGRGWYFDFPDTGERQNVDISFSYRKGRKEVLSDFSLSLEAGRVYGLLGKNGASTSLRCSI